MTERNGLSGPAPRRPGPRRSCQEEHGGRRPEGCAARPATDELKRRLHYGPGRLSSGRGVSLTGAVSAEGATGEGPDPRIPDGIAPAGSSPASSTASQFVQADAAMGLSLANVRRRRRAMDAIGRIGQVDPGQADGIVCAGPDRELPLGIDALPRKFGIVFVFRVPGNAFDLEVAARRGLFLAAHRRRIWEGEELAAAVIDAHVSGAPACSRLRSSLPADRCFAFGGGLERRNRFDRKAAGPANSISRASLATVKFRSRPREIRARIELSQQSRAHVELLCEFRLRAGVGERESSHRIEV